jgi:hypothetical protein
MSRTTTTLALALSALLLAGTPALAGPKKAPRTAATPAPQATYLTPIEQLCQMRGHYTLTLARARDGGMSRFTALTIARRAQAESGTHPAYVVPYETIIRLVYDFSSLAPVRLQQEIERACLQSMTAQDLDTPPTEAEVARLRY